MHPQAEVHLAGVPWPLYKVVSVIVFGVVLLVVGAATLDAAAAVLSAAGTATAVWIGWGVVPRGRLSPVDDRNRPGNRIAA